jgi:hypothetical protein
LFKYKKSLKLNVFLFVNFKANNISKRPTEVTIQLGKDTHLNCSNNKTVYLSNKHYKYEWFKDTNLINEDFKKFVSVIFNLFKKY